jgi:MFS family permease
VSPLRLAAASARGTAATTFASLGVRNYRLFFIGQTVSLAGTWMQQVAQALLVLRLTGSGTALGLVVALQMLPVLVLGAWAGVVSDRIPKRRLLITTQSAAATTALALGVLVATDAVRLWMVYALALLLGLAQTFDNPARQSFVPEMVGATRLANALSLNSVMVNLARIVGPAVAALIIATAGLSVCFLVNGFSYVAVIGALAVMRPAELHTPPAPVTRPRVAEGFAYIARTPAVLFPLLMMTVIGTFAYELQVTLPLFAERTFGRPNSIGTMYALQGAGAIVGGLIVANRYRAKSPAALAYIAILFGLTMLGVAASPSLGTALGAIVIMGAASISLISVANTTVQLAADPAMRGRVMALWAIAFMGTTPIGGPLVGWIGDHLGPRYAIALGGISAIATGLAAIPALRRIGEPQEAGIIAPRDPSPSPAM